MNKNWYKSTEVWAGAIVFFGVIAKVAFGIDIPTEVILGVLGYSIVKGRVSRKQ